MSSCPRSLIYLLTLLSMLKPDDGVASGKQGKTNQAFDPGARDSLIQLIEKERIETEEWLRTSPSSYLATIHRVDFGDRHSLTVGNEEGNDVRIEDQEISAHHLWVTVRGDSFHVKTTDQAAAFSVKNTSMSEATLPPSAITVGRFTIRLSHQRFPAIIVFDPSSPRFNEYKGLKYFPVDLGYRFILPLKLNPKVDTVAILSTRGNRRKAVKVGWFDFRVDGVRCRLEVTRLLEPGVGEKSYSIFFRDRTCGKESYAMGRYLEAEQRDDGLFVLDFNNAYNPACAFSEHYNCPVPPAENHLPVRIRAGEMDSHYMSH